MATHNNPKYKGLDIRTGTKRIRMRIPEHKFEGSTGKTDWDEALQVLNAKRDQLDGKAAGIPERVSHIEAWDLYYADKKHDWSKSRSMLDNEWAHFERMCGKGTKRRFGKGANSKPAIHWNALPIDSLADLDSNILKEHINDRLEQGASKSIAKGEYEFIRRLVQCLLIHKKAAPSMESIKLKMQKIKNRRLRIPTVSEIREICSHMLEHHADYVMCLAYTGCRSQEMAKAKFDDIEYDANGNMTGIWLENTKVNQVYFKSFVDSDGNELAWTQIIKKRLAKRDPLCQWIFPAPSDPKRHRDHSTEYWHRAIAKTNINSPAIIALRKNNGEKLCPHHLRHFVGASLAQQGYNESSIQGALQQSDPRSAQTYIAQVGNPLERETAGVIDSLF